MSPEMTFWSSIIVFALVVVIAWFLLKRDSHYHDDHGHHTT